MKPELIFTRLFKPMSSNWQLYLQSWDRIRTAEEAIGLLYAGVSPKMSRELEHHQRYGVLSRQERSVHDRELQKRLEFYLNWARNMPNPEVAAVAQQIIAKYWLRMCKSSMTPGSTQTLLVYFLWGIKGAIYPSLYESPYPRFVSEYLIWLFGQRPAGGFSISDSVPVFIEWGMGHILAGKRERELIPFIENYLGEDNLNRLLQEGLTQEAFEPLRNLNESDEACQSRAAHALIQLKMMDGYKLTLEKMPR